MEISFFVSWLSTIATTMLQNCQAGNKRRSSAFHQIGTLARATSCIDVYIHISGSDDGCIRLREREHVHLHDLGSPYSTERRYC